MSTSQRGFTIGRIGRPAIIIVYKKYPRRTNPLFVGPFETIISEYACLGSLPTRARATAITIAINTLYYYYYYCRHPPNENTPLTCVGDRRPNVFPKPRKTRTAGGRRR